MNKMNIIMMPIADIKPYENNPRHNERGVDDVATSIRKYGFQQPIVVDKQGIIVVGHTRYYAAKLLGYTEVPVHVSELDDEKNREYRIVDNKTNEATGWDFMKLEMETIDLDFSDFNFDLHANFSDLQDDEADENYIDDESSDVSTTAKEKHDDNKDENVEELLNSVWKQYAHEYVEQFDALYKIGYTFSGISPALAKIRFIEAKFYGKEYPRYLSLAFHTQQFMTNGDLYSAYDGLKRVADGSIKPERLRFCCNDNIDRITRGSLSFSGARMPLDFPVELAAQLIREFANGGKILDPCHGWGGRLIGAMLCDIEHYTGVDASDLQHIGVTKIFNAFEPYSATKSVKLINSPFEKAEIEENYYDFALTSPPYFDTEHYLGGEQSHAVYDNYSLWRDGFYTELISKVYKALKKGCVFALQVGSQRYPLATDGKAIAEKIGFTFVERRETNMRNTFNEVDESHAECVLILKK